MIWATVSSRSCFCWLYRTSPSLASKNIINLISVLTIWWCPCVESSLCVVGRGCLLWPVHSLGRTLQAFALLHSVLQGQICLLLQVFLDFLLLHSSPLYNLFTRIVNRYLDQQSDILFLSCINKHKSLLWTYAISFCILSSRSKNPLPFLWRNHLFLTPTIRFW